MKVYILRDTQEAPEHWVESFLIPDIDGKGVLILEQEIIDKACNIALDRLKEFQYENNM